MLAGSLAAFSRRRALFGSPSSLFLSRNPWLVASAGPFVTKRKSAGKKSNEKKKAATGVVVPSAAAAAVEAAKARHTATRRTIRDVRMIASCFEECVG